MTLSLGWWLFERRYDYRDKHHGGSRPPGVGRLAVDFGVAAISLHLAAMPYNSIIRASNYLDSFNRGAHAQQVARSHFNYMTRRGMPISKASMRHFASQGVGHRGFRYAFFGDPMGLNQVLTKGRYLRFAGKAGARLIPGLGWALLAYDVYTVAKMISD